MSDNNKDKRQDTTQVEGILYEITYFQRSVPKMKFPLNRSSKYSLIQTFNNLGNSIKLIGSDFKSKYKTIKWTELEKLCEYIKSKGFGISDDYLIKSVSRFTSNKSLFEDCRMFKRQPSNIDTNYKYSTKTSNSIRTVKKS